MHFGLEEHTWARSQPEEAVNLESRASKGRELAISSKMD